MHCSRRSFCMPSHHPQVPAQFRFEDRCMLCVFADLPLSPWSQQPTCKSSEIVWLTRLTDLKTHFCLHLVVVVSLSDWFVFSLRSLFPLSKKSPTLEQQIPFVTPQTPVSTINLSQSYSTFSSPSVSTANVSLSKRFSLDHVFSRSRKSSRATLPLLSPPASE